MRYSATCILLSWFLLYHSRVNAQPPRDSTLVVLTDPAVMRLTIDSMPFARVKVLDNRFDTVTFRTRETGAYPLVRETFSTSTATTISRFYEKELADVKRKGDGELLINITQLRTGNSYAVLRRAEHGPDRWEPARFTIQFSGQAYFRTGPDRYRKIMNFDYYLHMTSEGWTATEDYLPWVLNRILLSATHLDGKLPPWDKGLSHRPWARGDRKYFDPVHEQRDWTLAEIDQPVRSEWANYAIVNHPPTERGVYMNFDDFREGRVTPGEVNMGPDDKDSIYRLAPGPLAPLKIKIKGIRKLHFWPYAVADSSGLYINLRRKNQYIRIVPSANSFYFRVPNSLPDMYALLSEDCWNAGRGRGSGAHIPFGNPAAAVAGAVAASTIHDAVNPPPPRSGRRDETNQDYRNCFIDMNNGDIIYY